MTREELYVKISECREQNGKFETAYQSKIGPNMELQEWLNMIECDLDNDVIPEKFLEIISHNIDDLNLQSLSATHYKWDQQKEQDRYYADRISLKIQCKKYYRSYILYKSVGFAQKNTVIIGANGSGKTTLANKLKETLNVEDGIVIPAQKLLFIPTFDNIPTYKAEKLPFEEYQKRIFDDKKTFSAKSQDDFPYELTKEYGSEFRRVLALLVAERTAKRNEVIDNKTEGSVFHREEFKTTIDVVMDIWNDLILHRKMSLDADSNLIISYERDGEINTYEAYRMSDGERIIMYLAGRIMQAPRNGLIIVDEPEIFLHRTVVEKLWNRLEKERRDCTFIYMTHDLQFATSRVGVKSWIRSYEYPSRWDIQLIDENDIPEQLLMELLGSCKQILFCEGTSTTSLDKKIFDVLFPNFIIYPLESCKSVINYTKAYNAIPNTNTKAYGLVDSDFRSTKEINALKASNVYSYHVAEIENVFLAEGFLKAFQEHHHLGGSVEKIKEGIISMLERDKEAQCANYVSARIDYYYRANHLARGNTKAEVEKKVKEFNAEVKIEEWYKKRMKELELYIQKKSYAKVIAVYNNKGLHSVVEREFGLRNYHTMALEFFKKAPNSVLEKLRQLFPAELWNLS